MNKIRVVAATRRNVDEFSRESRLGVSLSRLKFDSRISADVTFENTKGLPALYNHAIRDAQPDEILLFIHDDISIDDFHLFIRIHEALRAFDIVGVAGNARPDPRHVSWGFMVDTNNQLKWHDNQYLSGAIGNWVHGEQKVSGFGLVPRQCVLLDGCFLAARGDQLRDRQIFFDEQFDFHFYDLDFCQTAMRQGLRLGTWPIAITHDSVGDFLSPAWKAALPRYLQKWSNKPAG